MPVSSQTLFHFTKEYSTLKQILQDGGFWPHYCTEIGWGKDESLSWAVPMTCFTDIPFHSLLEHINWYGNYGIGMSKEWAIKNSNISPVLYLNRTSSWVLNTISKRSHSKGPWSVADYMLFALLKRYEGPTIDKEGRRRRKILYDEREWRYIPTIDPQYRFIPLENGEEFDATTMNQRTFAYKAKFKASDIHHIIIHDESEKSALMDDIDNIFTSLSPNERLSLKSKIISREYLEQII